MKRLSALLLLAFTPLAFAEDKPKKSTQPAEPIILPADPTPPKPPAPDPTIPAQLGSDQIYLVRANVDCVVISSPSGILKVTKDTGPVKIKAKFYGGSGQFESKTFSEKYIFSVETLAKGSAELLIIPSGAGEADIIRRRIDALDGPQPPPTPPEPPVPPTPPTPTDPLTKAFQAAFDQDRDSDRADSLKFLQLVYKGLAVAAPSRPETTNADFVAWMKTAIEFSAKNPGGLQLAQLKTLRTAVGVELLRAWGATKVPLTAADAGKELDVIAKALAGVR